MPNLSPDLLSQRLRDLDQAGVLRRDRLPPPIAAQVYELTDRGRELEPVVLGLGRWGSRAPFPPGNTTLGVDSLILALETLYDPGRADGLVGSSFELRLADQRFEARPRNGRLDVARGAASPVPPRTPRIPVTASC